MRDNRIEAVGRSVSAGLGTACVGWTMAVGCAGSSGAARPATPFVVTSADLTPSKDGGPSSISPKLLEPHRLTGEKTVVPDDETMHAVANSVGRLVGSFNLCLDIEGHTMSVRVVQTTRAPSYDERIMSEIRRWSYTPVMLDGERIPVCTTVTFIFTAH